MSDMILQANWSLVVVQLSLFLINKFVNKLPENRAQLLLAVCVGRMPVWINMVSLHWLAFYSTLDFKRESFLPKYNTVPSFKAGCPCQHQGSGDGKGRTGGQEGGSPALVPLLAGSGDSQSVTLYLDCLSGSERANSLLRVVTFYELVVWEQSPKTVSGKGGPTGSRRSEAAPRST